MAILVMCANFFSDVHCWALQNDKYAKGDQETFNAQKRTNLCPRYRRRDGGVQKYGGKSVDAALAIYPPGPGREAGKPYDESRSG
jgi:hypothetical protein